MTCTHEEETSRWVDEHEDDWGDRQEGQWVYTTRSLCKDLDLHRWTCTRCGHIGYYSGAARAFHEDGKTSDIPGLGG